MADSNELLRFGQSHWDYLPDLVKDHIVALAKKIAQRDLAARKLHQMRMKELCHEIKAHYHWVNYCKIPITIAQRCDNCDEYISPEFDMGRHRGVCIRDTAEDVDWTTVVFSKELEDDIREWLLTMQHRTP